MDRLKSRPVSEQVLDRPGHDVDELVDATEVGGFLPFSRVTHDAEAKGVCAEVGQAHTIVIFGLTGRSESLPAAEDQLFAADMNVETASGIVLFEQGQKAIAQRIELGHGYPDSSHLGSESDPQVRQGVPV